MSYFYWELILKDGTRYEIPPAGVAVVDRRMKDRDAVKLNTATVPYSEIKYFRQTNKPYGQDLLDAAAQAFDEPVENRDGSMVIQWVKKPVTQREYATYYSSIPAYHKVGTENSMVMVAFRLPIHQIDTSLVQPCSPDEISRLP